MNLIKIISLFIFCYISTYATAQIDWSHPNIEITGFDGLPSTYIKDFAEDEFGFIWILTYSGLCRFDGSHLEVLQDTLLPKEGYLEMEYDTYRKTLWISHVTGVFAYHLPTGTFKRYRQKNGSGGNPITTLVIGSNHEIWLGSRGFFGKITTETDSIQTIPILLKHPKFEEDAFNRVFHILLDPIEKDKIWLSTAAGIITFSPTLNTFQYANDLIGNEPILLIDNMYGSKKTGRIYFSINNVSEVNTDINYFTFDSKLNRTLPSLKLHNSISNYKISSFQDSLLLFSNPDGVLFFNERKGKVTRRLVNKKENSIDYRVDFIDSKENIWVSSHEGIKMYQTVSSQAGSYFYSTNKPNWYHIPSNLIYDELSNSLLLSVTGGEGLYQVDLETKKWKLFPRLNKNKEFLKCNFTGVARLQNEEILAIGRNGFYELSESGEMSKTDFSIAPVGGWGITFVDSKNILWGVKNKEIIQLDLATKEHAIISSKIHYCDTYLGEMIFFEDSNSNIWIIGLCGGIDKYDRQKGTFQPIETQSFIEGESVTGIDEYDGQIWAKTDNGEILVLDVNATEKGIIEVINLKEKIAKKEVSLINRTSLNETYFNSGVFDDLGKFWFFTQNGLYCYNKEKTTLELFDESVGIVINDPDMNVFIANFLRKLPNGNIAYTTRKGICIFNPHRLSNQKDLPKPYIHRLDINNQPSFSDSNAIFKKNYQFSPHENFIGVDFSAIDFANAKNVEYRYQLLGVDETWKNPGNRKYVSYTDLKGGDYTFLLKASNEAGSWLGEAVSINFEVADFWYNTLWAKVLFLLILIATIFAIYMSRLKRAIEKEQVKIKYEREFAQIKMQALTAQMNPHFIFNSLNSIDYYIIKNDTKKASRYLNRFSRLMRLILKNSQSNYITLKDDLDALKLYLEIEALRFNHQFNFEIKMGENVDSNFLKIPPMLIQPYVENSIWHGLLHKKEDGKITIHFELKEAEELLTCTVIDNGIGRQKSMKLKAKNAVEKERKSFGMNITKDKIEALKFLHGIDAKVEIFDLYDIDNQSIGTKVELRIPV